MMHRISEPMVVGLHAKAHSGKDTIARELQDNFGFEIISIGSPLKDASSDLTGIPRDWFDRDDKKEEIVPEWGMSPRRIAQFMGAEFAENLIHPNFLVKRMDQIIRNKLDEGISVVIPDIRRDYQAEWISQGFQNGSVWFLDRPDAPKVEDHVTEQMSYDPTIHDRYVDCNRELNDVLAHINNLIFESIPSAK